MDIIPISGTSQIRIATGDVALGDLLLWVPEGVMTDTGSSSTYPAGTEWQTVGQSLVQQVSREHLFGPGNCPEVEPGVLECAGIRFQVDGPVEWTTTASVEGDRVAFAIRLSNVGDRMLRKVAAAVCLRFLGADWWSDEETFVLSGGVARALSELGRDAGRDNGFQAYLLRDQSFGHPFYREFWGFNRARLDVPVMVSHDPGAGLCVGIETDSAYFLHSNRGNPCTDVMLALGDVGPGEVVEAEGSVWVREGSPEDFLGPL